jgi:Skp family chaperone for outer membrane proteins
MEDVQTEVVKIVGGIAEKEGITLVLRRSQVFLAAKTIDITDMVLKELDQKMPSLKVNTAKGAK